MRIFPEKRSDHRPAYIDSPTRETWEEPLRRAPGELICRTEPRCIKEVREQQTEGIARKRAIRAARSPSARSINRTDNDRARRGGDIAGRDLQVAHTGPRSGAPADGFPSRNLSRSLSQVWFPEIWIKGAAQCAVASSRDSPPLEAAIRAETFEVTVCSQIIV